MLIGWIRIASDGRSLSTSDPNALRDGRCMNWRPSGGSRIISRFRDYKSVFNIVIRKRCPVSRALGLRACLQYNDLPVSSTKRLGT